MADIATEAEKVIKGLQHKDKWNNTVIDLKTNQIRKILTAVNSLTGRIDVYKAQNGQQASQEADKECHCIQYVHRVYSDDAGGR